jgi:DNA polymerase III subunit delta'
MLPWLESPLQQLAERKLSNKLHHALLMQGPQGLGKSEFAQQLSAILLCNNLQGIRPCENCHSCHLHKAGSHPDKHEVKSEKQIGVDQIRDAIKKLSGSAQLSGAKVLIIYQAHSMTESSANALLKTLEEPTANTYIVMLSHKAQQLLPTILSRCEKLALPLPSLEQAKDWLQAHWPEKIDERLIAMYQHSPLSLLAELGEEQTVGFTDFTSGIDAVIKGQVDPVTLASNWQQEAEKLVKWLQFWLAKQIQEQAVFNDKLWSLQQRCVSAQKILRNAGANKVLIFSSLLNELTQLNKQ